jgi:hypothetical protein
MAGLFPERVLELKVHWILGTFCARIADVSLDVPANEKRKYREKNKR